MSAPARLSVRLLVPVAVGAAFVGVFMAVVFAVSRASGFPVAPHVLGRAVGGLAVSLAVVGLIAGLVAVTLARWVALVVGAWAALMLVGAVAIVVVFPEATAAALLAAERTNAHEEPLTLDGPPGARLVRHPTLGFSLRVSDSTELVPSDDPRARGMKQALGDLGGGHMLLDAQRGCVLGVVIAEPVVSIPALDEFARGAAKSAIESGLDATVFGASTEPTLRTISLANALGSGAMVTFFAATKTPAVWSHGVMLLEVGAGPAGCGADLAARLTLAR